VRWVLFAGAGLVAGAASGMLGIGGAALSTPLLRFLGVSPHLAIGTTVPVILPSTLTAAYTFRRADLVDARVAVWTAAAGAVAAPAGALATRHTSGHGLMLVLAGILLALGIQSLSPGTAAEQTAEPPRRDPVLLLALGAVAGFFSGLLGIGGGFLLVPVYIRGLRFPVKRALGTSLAVITLTTLPNIAAQAYVGNVDWRVAGLLTLGVVPGARLGALVAVRAPERVIRPVVAVAVVGVALVYAALELAELFFR
jgi:uncharacterized membrane protein YfcA